METTARVHSKGSRYSRSSRSGSRRAPGSSQRTDVEQPLQQGSQQVTEPEPAIKNRPGRVVRARPEQPETPDSGSSATIVSSVTSNTTSNTNNINNNDEGYNTVNRRDAAPEPKEDVVELQEPGVSQRVENATLAVETAAIDTVPGSEDKLQKGILGYMDRQLKVQSLSDPQKSPAQRSTRSRSSLEKSPRSKRSKSESRRRRERKIIAAGEMEVRQANETLMRYLKQCSDFNDASLSGDLEITENLEDRRVHRKTKSQRERKQLQQPQSDRPARTNGDDCGHYHGEIYNPFTPVVSPTTDLAPTRIDKLYIQTASGYRAVDNSYSYRKPPGMIGGDPESNSDTINTSVHLSCAVQRVWHLISNVCHGLLGGLALAHLLLICTTKPYDWVEASIRHYSSFAEVYANTFYCLAIVCMVSIFDRVDIAHLGGDGNISFRSVIIIMIYAATIVLSLSAGSMDERLYLSASNVTVWEEELETNKVLSIWNALSIARSIGAVFGWLVVGFIPHQDHLYEHLLEMEKYQPQ